MADSAFNVLQNDRCDNLRWKGLFIDTDADPNGKDHIYWCAKTQFALGPDGKIVDNYDCNPARPCYRAL